MQEAKEQVNSPSSAERVESAWRERGWPPDTLARARELHISNTALERMLSWDATLERVEEEVRWAEQLEHGTMSFRQVTVTDAEAFCALWANSPEQIGEWDLTVERGPDAFAQFELQERPVLNALFDRGVMVACVSFSLRHTLVGGQRVPVRYGQAMRVHKDYRGRALAHWVRSLPWAVGLSRPTQVQYDFIRPQNMTMERWNRKFMPTVESVPIREDDVPGIPVRVLQYPARPASASRPGVRPARREDYERMVTLINRTHAGRDLFRPYTVEFLVDRVDPWYAFPGPGSWKPPYGCDDLYVVERDGEVVACAGLWDRGRDVRERWRHRESGEERVVSVTALLDVGYAEGCEQEMAEVIEHLIGVTHELGRDFLIAPMETMPEVEALVADRRPSAETRYMQWRAETPRIKAPVHVDLAYW